MYTLDRIVHEIEEYCAMVNVKLTVPVEINARLKTTYGREFDRTDSVGYCRPEKIDFSKQMIDSMTDEFISGVIRHETAHYITTVKTHEHHGHDDVFRYWGRCIGCTEDEIKSTTKPRYKNGCVQLIIRYISMIFTAILVEKWLTTARASAG